MKQITIEQIKLYNRYVWHFGGPRIRFEEYYDAERGQVFYRILK